jgi:hypothetical protein
MQSELGRDTRQQRQGTERFQQGIDHDVSQ